MTVLPDIPELQMIGVLDRGQANKERIVLKPKMALDIGNYAVLVGLRTPTANFIMPLRDHLFWFGSGLVYPSDWLFLYTGHGVPSRLPYEPESGHLLTIYWGRDETVFHDPQVVPAIVKFSNILIEQRPQPQPQPPQTVPFLGALEALKK